MQIKSGELNLNEHLTNTQLLKTKKKKKTSVIPVELKSNEIKKEDKKEESPLASLNKQKVELKDLNEKLEELKKKNEKKSIDPADKNKDGKVSEEEKAQSKKKNIEPADKNRDGKLSQKEKKEFEKKTKEAVENILKELKKDENNKIEIKDFKNISKMINNEFLDSKDANKINSFLKN